MRFMPVPLDGLNVEERTELVYNTQEKVHNIIEAIYSVVPQLVQKGENLGFNVRGRAAGVVIVTPSLLSYQVFSGGDRQPVFTNR